MIGGGDGNGNGKKSKPSQNIASKRGSITTWITCTQHYTTNPI